MLECHLDFRIPRNQTERTGCKTFLKLSISKKQFVISSFYLNVASMTLNEDISHFLINPFTLRVALTGLNKFGNILLTKAFSGKHFKEKCFPEAIQAIQPSFIFLNFCFH